MVLKDAIQFKIDTFNVLKKVYMHYKKEMWMIYNKKKSK